MSTPLIINVNLESREPMMINLTDVVTIIPANVYNTVVAPPPGTKSIINLRGGGMVCSPLSPAEVLDRIQDAMNMRRQANTRLGRLDG